MHDGRHQSDDEGARRAATGGWLTYRYRFAAPGGEEATGTMKAPSFLDAARRILSTRLADRVGPEGGFLRLRAAGEDEVLLRVDRPAGGAYRIEGVSPDAYSFAESDGPAED